MLEPWSKRLHVLLVWKVCLCHGFIDSILSTNAERGVLSRVFAGEIKTISGPMDPGKFLATNCWGKEPLLIRNAFDAGQLRESLSVWPSWETVIEIATEEDAPTRLIRQADPTDPSSYSLEMGPISRDWYQNQQQRPSALWTLVVNDVEQFYSPLSDWMDQTFHFLPRWRRDDGQVSLAPQGGGIGPHVDNYDVFLIQSSGQRQWDVGTKDINVQEEMDSLFPDIDVRILKDWRARQGHVVTLQLHAGDLLYLPPRIPHCGTSLSDDCMTISVGCRAPSAAQLVGRIAEQVSQSAQPMATKRFQEQDIDSEVSKGHHMLHEEVKEQMKQMVRDAIDEILDDNATWDDLVGRLVTEPNRLRDYPLPLVYPDGESSNLQDLGDWGDANATLHEILLKNHGALYRAEGVSFTYSNSMGMIRRLFVHGEVFLIECTTKEECAQVDDFLPLIIEAPCLSKTLIPADNEKITELLRDLLNQGFLYGSDDD